MIPAEDVRVIVVELEAPFLGHDRSVVAVRPGALVDQAIAGYPRIGFEPHFQSDLTGQVEGVAVRHQHKIINAVEQEPLAYHARSEGGAAHQQTVIVAEGVIGVALSAPPTHQAQGRRNAVSWLRRPSRSALAGCPGMVYGEDLGGR